MLTGAKLFRVHHWMMVQGVWPVSLAGGRSLLELCFPFCISPFSFIFFFFPQELYRLNSWDDSGDFAQRLQEYHRADRQGLQRKCILIPQLLSCKVPRARPARPSPACSTRLGRLPPWSSERCQSWGIYPEKGNKACEVEKEHRDTQGSLQHSRDFTPWVSYAELPSKYSPDLKQLSLSEHPTSR